MYSDYVAHRKKKCSRCHTHLMHICYSSVKLDVNVAYQIINLKKRGFFLIILKCKHYIIMYHDFKETHMGKTLSVLLLCLHMYFCCTLDHKCMVITVSKV